MKPIFLADCKNSAKVFRAINHKLRQNILWHVFDSEKTVTNLYTKLRTEQSIMSINLKVLLKAGLVTRRKEGKEAYYLANQETLKLIEQANKLLKLNTP